MLYNEEAVRANIRNREGKRIFYLGKGRSAHQRRRDYLSRERIEIRPGRAGEAGLLSPSHRRLPDGKAGAYDPLKRGFSGGEGSPQNYFPGKAGYAGIGADPLPADGQGLGSPCRGDSGIGAADHPLRGAGRAAAMGQALRPDGGGAAQAQPFSPGLLRSAPFHALGGGRGGHCRLNRAGALPGRQSWRR